MAQFNTLVTSYYEWLLKTEAKLRSNRVENMDIIRRMPTTHPTVLSEIAHHTEKVLTALNGSEYHDRAVYWNNLFSSILKEGWRG